MQSVLPPTQPTPSAQHPFIYFHLRKSGGSAFRMEVAASAALHGHTFFVPCNENVNPGLGVNLAALSTTGLPARDRHMASCHNYHFDRILGLSAARNASVFAACWYWDFALQELEVMRHWAAAVRYAHSGLYRSMDISERRNLPLSCVILVREPISRTVSCYNEYFRHHLLHGRPLQSLSLVHAADLLANLSDTHQGCVNEISRWLSPSVGWGDWAINLGQISRKAIDETKRRISQCVVGDMTARTADTLRVLRHWFPWLRLSGANIGHQSLRMKKTDPPISEALRNLLSQANAVDHELYSFAMERFELQLAALGGNESVTTRAAVGDTTAGDGTAGDTTVGGGTAGDGTASDGIAGDWTAGDGTAGEGTAGGRRLGDAGLVQCSEAPMVAVLLFGAVRGNTALTRRSHTLSVIKPLEQFANASAPVVDVFVHSMLVPQIVNPRAGERPLMSTSSWQPGGFAALGPACRYMAEDQDFVDVLVLSKFGVSGIEAVAKAGVNVSSTAATYANAYRAWYSLWRAAGMARARERLVGSTYRFVCVLRSDTAVYTSIGPALPHLAQLSDAIALPNYQHWGGLNDRFALGHRDVMFDLYTQQLQLAHGQWQLTGTHSSNTESFLCGLLRERKVHLLLTDTCIVRVRSSGQCLQRDFMYRVEAKKPLCLPATYDNWTMVSQPNGSRPCGTGTGRASLTATRKCPTLDGDRDS